MVAISSPQYVWALFTQPLGTALGAGLAELQVTFSILIVVQTFLSPWQGAMVDRFGPRLLLSIGAMLTGVSWVLAARVSTVSGLYLSYGLLGGIGTGIIYIGVVGHVVRWFPDRKGLATGIVAAGYGMGALLTTFPVARVLETAGHQAALTRFGLIFGAIGLIAAQGLRRPTPTLLDDCAATEHHRSAGITNVAPAHMLRSRIFWLMFVMMTMMSTTGLMVTSQMGAFSRDFGMADAVLFGLPVLPLALSLDRLTNGFTRPFFGWVSDRLGRENTMFIAFAFEGTAMAVWLLTLSNPLLFVVVSGVVFFGWGEIFSLFPSTLTDTFGTKHATTNYGFLYMAQGVGSVLGGPVAAYLHQVSGSWVPIFLIVIAMDWTTAVLAIRALKPMRQRWRERVVEPAAVHQHQLHVESGKGEVQGRFEVSTFSATTRR